MTIRLSPLACIAALLCGCGSMTGLTESAKFACKAPDGVSCTSVSGVYANAQQYNLPSQQTRTRPTASATTDASNVAAAAPTLFPEITAGMPIRSQPRMLRIWMAPWRDEDDTLHDQAYRYVMVDPGKWLIERSREGTVQKSMNRLQLLGQRRSAASPPAVAEQPAGNGTLARVRDNVQAQQDARETAVAPSDEEDAK